jgi:PAS domain-containing protein
VVFKEGRPTGLRGIMIDITDRKRAEQALRESEEKFSRAFQLNPDTVIITRMKDGTILDVNESFTHIHRLFTRGGYWPFQRCGS